MSKQQKPRLITITLSHYCEKVRWALDYLNIDYIEESHSPLFHRRYTSRYGGTTVPVLVTAERALINSQEILHYLDRLAENKKLYPEEPQLRDRVETLEKLFDEKLGVATRTWGYYYAIKKPGKIAIAWGIKAPLREKIKTAIAFPKMPQILQQFYDVTPETKDAALNDIKEVFSVVNREINANKQYLAAVNRGTPGCLIPVVL